MKRKAEDDRRRQKARPCVLWGLCMMLLCAACGEAESSRDAQSRNSVDRATVTRLIQSQDALRQGALHAALVLADSVVRGAPRLADAHFQRGRVLSELKRFEQAEEAYREVLALDPEYRGAWGNLGNNAFRQQQYEEALAHYRKEQALEDSPATLVSMGRAYDAMGETDSARQAYEQALAMDSTLAAAHVRLGQLYEEGTLEEALRFSQQGLRLEPENADYRYVVGSQLLQLGRVEEAVRHLEAVTEEQPWHQGAHYNLGRALLRMGRQDEAEQYTTRADSLRALESEVERLQSQALASPEDPRRWVRLGEMLHRSGQLQEAKDVFSVALYLDPQNPSLRNSVAMLQSDLGNEEAALRHYQALLNQHPTFVEGWFNLGVIYARNGNPQQAREAWQRVLQLVPDHELAQTYLARLEASSSTQTQ